MALKTSKIWILILPLNEVLLSCLMYFLNSSQYHGMKLRISRNFWSFPKIPFKKGINTSPVAELSYINVKIKTNIYFFVSSTYFQQRFSFVLTGRNLSSISGLCTSAKYFSVSNCHFLNDQQWRTNGVRHNVAKQTITENLTVLCLDAGFELMNLGFVDLMLYQLPSKIWDLHNYDCWPHKCDVWISDTVPSWS